MQVTKENLKITAITETATTGRFEFEPLPQGFGATFGNSLRRIILSAINGAAITQAKFAGVSHQFTTIDGVKEDVVELTLNLKKIRVKLHTVNPVVLTLKKKGPGVVTAGDIETTADAEILNKDLHIATLADKKAELGLELVAEPGIGYSPMEERQTTKIGVIVLDALFSPIINSSYLVEPTRFGRRADLDKLILDIETDGSISPRDALNRAAEILRSYYDVIIAGGLIETESEKIQAATDAAPKKTVEDISVEELPLQTRTVNALKKQGIDTLKQLSEKSDEDLADIKNLGEKSLNEIKKLLEKEGLRK